MTRQRVALQAQLRAARAIGDRAAELMIGARLHLTCACGRPLRRSSDWRLCDPCRDRMLAVERVPRVVMQRWAP